MEKNRERTQRKKIVKIMVRLHFERVQVQAYFEIKFRSQSKVTAYLKADKYGMGLV